MADIVVFLPAEDWPGAHKLEADPIVDVEPFEHREAYRFHRDMFSARLAYVRHPHYSSFLIPYSEFDDYVLQDKFNETLRVLTELGASSIRCSSHRGRHRRFRAGAKAFDRGVEVSRERSQNSRFDYSFAGAGGPPTDPRPLRWPGEPGLEAAIEGVIRNGATAVKITVKRDDSISMNTEIPVRLKKIGVELGVHSARGQVDTLEFEATFPARTRQGRAR